VVFTIDAKLIDILPRMYRDLEPSRIVERSQAVLATILLFWLLFFEQKKKKELL
jgi:hypothetical protein